MNFKANSPEILKGFREVIQEENKDYIWSLGELTIRLNEKLRYEFNTKQVGFIIGKLQQDFYVFKNAHSKGHGMRYIFVPIRKIKKFK